MTREEMDLLIPKYEKLISDCYGNYESDKKVLAYEQFIEYIQEENEFFSNEDTEEELWEHFLEVASEYGYNHKIKFPIVIDYDAIFSFIPKDDKVAKRRKELIEIIKRELRSSKQDQHGGFGSIGFAEYLAEMINIFQNENETEENLWDCYMMNKEYEEDDEDQDQYNEEDE